jgi:16S rRNA (guanine527-N7)-methyltransferase
MGCQRNAATLLEEGLALLGLAPSPETVAAFLRYLEMLREASERMNLTSLRAPDEIVRRHFLESAAFGVALERAGLLARGAVVVDVGTGAGFPGLPLRLLRPDLRLTLVEATAKKIAFLREVVAALGLGDIELRNARAEAMGHDPALRERFDLAVSRAVAPVATLAELTLPLVRVSGASAAIKGSRLESELAAGATAIRRCGGGAAYELPFPLPEPAGPAPRILVLPKERPTPPELPRRSGVTPSRPLR